MQQVYRRTPMSKCDFNKVAKQLYEIKLRHGCSLVNLLDIFRTPFPRNTSGGLLPQYISRLFRIPISKGKKYILSLECETQVKLDSNIFFITILNSFSIDLRYINFEQLQCKSQMQLFLKEVSENCWGKNLVLNGL